MTSLCTHKTILDRDLPGCLCRTREGFGVWLWLDVGPGVLCRDHAILQNRDLVRDLPGVALLQLPWSVRTRPLCPDPSCAGHAPASYFQQLGKWGVIFSSPWMALVTSVHEEGRLGLTRAEVHEIMLQI